MAKWIKTVPSKWVLQVQILSGNVTFTFGRLEPPREPAIIKKWKSRHSRLTGFSYHWRLYTLLGGRLGSLSTRVFGPQMATGRELFFLLICLQTLTFTLLSIFSPLQMITLKIWETPLSWHAKCSLPVVGVRVLKTRVLTNVTLSFSIFTLKPLSPFYFWDNSSTLYDMNEMEWSRKTCDIAKLYFEVAFSSTSLS